jgi:transcriptional regulator with PAS, ATPase and Fis domain
MRRLYEMIAKAGRSTAPVLLLGETGTGKELVARCIHSAGSRREKAFVPVDCSALTPTLVESELFGHVKGAFTGAVYSERGLLQAGHEGTIFLDEIGELPMPLQAKLLRAIQEKEVRPVGSTKLIPIDDRVIAATNRDLEAEVHAGTFRQDLYYRLNVIQIRVPALRERKVDIPLLAAHLIEKFSDPLQPVRAISDDAMRRLISHDWPGNVRELRNAIERAVAMSSDAMLAVDDFEFAAVANRAPDHVHEAPELIPLSEIERRALVNAVRETGGNKVAAARLLGIGKTTLYRKLKEYGP